MRTCWTWLTLHFQRRKVRRFTLRRWIMASVSARSSTPNTVTSWIYGFSHKKKQNTKHFQSRLIRGRGPDQSERSRSVSSLGRDQSLSSWSVFGLGRTNPPLLTFGHSLNVTGTGIEWKASEKLNKFEPMEAIDLRLTRWTPPWERPGRWTQWK